MAKNDQKRSKLPKTTETTGDGLNKAKKRKSLPFPNKRANGEQIVTTPGSI